MYRDINKHWRHCLEPLPLAPAVSSGSVSTLPPRGDRRARWFVHSTGPYDSSWRLSSTCIGDPLILKSGNLRPRVKRSRAINGVKGEGLFMLSSQQRLLQMVQFVWQLQCFPARLLRVSPNSCECICHGYSIGKWNQCGLFKMEVECFISWLWLSGPAAFE